MAASTSMGRSPFLLALERVVNQPDSRKCLRRVKWLIINLINQAGHHDWGQIVHPASSSIGSVNSQPDPNARHSGHHDCRAAATLKELAKACVYRESYPHY